MVEAKVVADLVHLGAQVRAPRVRVDRTGSGQTGVGDARHGSGGEAVHDVVGQVGGGSGDVELGVELGRDGIVHHAVAVGRGGIGKGDGGGAVDDANGVAGPGRGLDEGELAMGAGGVLRGEVGRVGTVAVGIVAEDGIAQTLDGSGRGGIGGDDPHYQDGFGAGNGQATVAVGPVAVGRAEARAVDAWACGRGRGPVFEPQRLARRDGDGGRGLVDLGPRRQLEADSGGNAGARVGVCRSSKDDPLGLVGDVVGDVEPVGSAVGLLARDVGFFDGVVGVLDLDHRGVVARGGVGWSFETTIDAGGMVAVVVVVVVRGHFEVAVADELGFGGGGEEAKAEEDAESRRELHGGWIRGWMD